MLPTTPRLSVLPRISQPFKRSQEGLFHGKMKQYGNNVPHSKHKTRRTWLPNVQSKRLTSETTGETFKLKVTTSAMKSINKAGGLDNYLLNTKAELLGMQGMRLRVMVRERLAQEARDKEEAKRLEFLQEKLAKRRGSLNQAKETSPSTKSGNELSL